LEQQTGSIAGYLKTIDEDCPDLDRLEVQTARVVSNLERISELLEDHDIAAVVRQLSR